VLTRRPSSANALHGLAVARIGAGALDDGIELLREAISIKPDEPLFYVSLGRALLATGERDEGILSCCTALQLKPDDDLALVTLGAAINLKSGVQSLLMVDTCDFKTYCARKQLAFKKLADSLTITVKTPNVNNLSQRRIAGEMDFPETYIAELKNATVIFQYGYVITEDNVLLDDVFIHPERHRFQLTDKYIKIHQQCDASSDRVLLNFAQAKELDVEKCILISSRGSENYFHWLLEILPKLSLIDLCKEYDTVPLLVPEDLPKQYFEALGYVLGESNRPLLLMDRKDILTVNELIVPSSLSFMPFDYVAGAKPSFRDSIIHVAAIEYLREKVLSEPNIIQGHRKLYLSRRGAKYRKLVNDRAIEQLFLDNGFEIAFPEYLTFDEQVELFSEAGFIAGPAGAAFANIIFSPPNARIFILVSREEVNYYLFSSIADAAGQDLIYITGEPIEGSHKISYHRDYEIDLSKVKDIIEQYVNE